MFFNQMSSSSLMRSQTSPRHNLAERPISLNITRALTCQPQRIHPPRRVQGVPIPIEPTRQLARRSEEHTSELQSLMRLSYAVFCLQKQANYTKNEQSNI